MSNASKLTERSLARLLDLLDTDRDRAALAYEKLRERTAGLLEWWGSMNADELADETLDRVARKVDEGASVTQSSLAAYVRGVARLVFYEARRADRSDPLPSTEVAASPPEEEPRALECLDHCLNALAPQERRLVLLYYDDHKTETRQRIAKELDITMTALRIRMHRLRARLETCVSDCMKRFAHFEHPLRA
jgi:DNA-directed RNA polymerase specialized sigma24 family protein